MTLVDENAFGILIGYFAIEDDEYALERENFVERFSEFRAATLDFAVTLPVAEHAALFDLGHAVYIEFAEGEQREDPLAWAKAARALLMGRRFDSAVIVAHGSRWREEDGEELPDVGEPGPGLLLVQMSRPSEPLRRALAAEVASRRADADDERGWGPGLYVDTEAIEALGRAPKNAPTALEIAGATFYRVGR
ncbi:MAG TPA: hypothetical protein VGP93_11440 [Polyangiaceae bacterium]|jgi:hypothetical protein|nr:hypothetical protein [Polyangiaceae bacterium]